MSYFVWYTYVYLYSYPDSSWKCVSWIIVFDFIFKRGCYTGKNESDVIMHQLGVLPFRGLYRCTREVNSQLQKSETISTKNIKNLKKKISEAQNLKHHLLNYLCDTVYTCVVIAWFSTCTFLYRIYDSVYKWKFRLIIICFVMYKSDQSIKQQLK